jgi:hypothetical protein
MQDLPYLNLVWKLQILQEPAHLLPRKNPIVVSIYPLENLDKKLKELFMGFELLV